MEFKAKDFNGYAITYMDIMYQRYVIAGLRSKCKMESTEEKFIEMVNEEDRPFFNKFICRLLEIMATNHIPLQHIEEEEAVGISLCVPMFNYIYSYLAKEANLPAINIGISDEDILLYNIVKSIYLVNAGLLENIKYDENSEIEHIYQTYNYDKNEFSKVIKIVKSITTITETYERKSLESNNMLDSYNLAVKETMDTALTESEVYGDKMVLYLKRLFNCKIATISIYGFYRFASNYYVTPEVMKTLDSSDDLLNFRKYGQFIVSELLKSLHLEIYGYNKELNVLANYNSFISNYLMELKNELNLGATINTEIEQAQQELILEERALRKEIKEVKSKLHEIRLKNRQIECSKSIEKEKTEVITSVLPEVETYDVFTIDEKIEMIKESRVTICTSLTILKEYENRLDIIDASQFRGKSFNPEFNYIVKITKGIDHAIGYDIDAEAQKINAKSITTSRTNINLILDEILAQI